MLPLAGEKRLLLFLQLLDASKDFVAPEIATGHQPEGVWLLTPPLEEVGPNQLRSLCQKSVPAG